MTSRFLTFKAAGRTRYGLWHPEGITDLSETYGNIWPGLREVIEAGALETLAREAPVRVDFRESEIEYLIPVVNPEKIICVGVNFPDRNEEYKDGQQAPENPSLFIRFPRSFVGHRQPLCRPPESIQLDYEGEIVIIIGKQGRRIGQEQALNHIAALSLCNEGTLRDWVRHAKFNVTQGKNFDASGAIGPWLIPYQSEEQLKNVSLTTRVNGELRQNDVTDRMIFSFKKIIAYISTFTTLVPGDVIVTGTPTGAGARLEPPQWLKPGDVVKVEATGLGCLENPVADERPGASC